MKRPNPGDCMHPDGCQTGPDGGPRRSSRGGWCEVHRMRVQRKGHPGPPGMLQGTGAPRGHLDEAAAQSLLDQVPPRIGRGLILRRRPGTSTIDWADGTRAKIAQPTLEAWRRRGWAHIGEHQYPSGNQEVVILKGARADARAALERVARNRVRHARRNGLKTP